MKTTVGQNTQPELDLLWNSQPVELMEQWSCFLAKKISHSEGFRTDCSLLRMWPEIVTKTEQQ